MQCPVCETGILAPVVYSDCFSGNLVVQDLHGSYCNTCNEIIILIDDIRHNANLIKEARMNSKP
jgi:hypothetical protein